MWVMPRETQMTTKNRKVKPPFRADGIKNVLIGWVVEKLPENYKNLTYIEPYIRSSGVLLNKEDSPVEVLAELDLGTIQIFRALRDEPSQFLGRLKRTKYTKARFDKAVKQSSTEFTDYLDQAVNEYILRKMSRNGQKTVFYEDGASGWDNAVRNELPLVGKRLEKVHIFNKSAIEVIKAFDEETTVCFCDPPAVDEEKSSLDQHILLYKTLASFRGKAIVHGPSCTLYKRLYKNWKCVKKKNPSSSVSDCFWFNY